MTWCKCSRAYVAYGGKCPGVYDQGYVTGGSIGGTWPVTLRPGVHNLRPKKDFFAAVKLKNIFKQIFMLIYLNCKKVKSKNSKL